MKKRGIVLTPNDFTHDPIEFSQKENEEYQQYVSEELAKFIDTIQFGLSFFGIKAFINKNHKNQIDFYDSNNNLLHSQKIETPKNKTELIMCILKAQFSGKFKTSLGEFSWKTDPKYEGDNNENYFFDLNCGDYSKTIFVYRRNGKIQSIEAQIVGQEDFNIKEIDVAEIGGEWVKFRLDDNFGPNGNHEEGKVRRLDYNKSISNNDIYAAMREQHGKKRKTSLDSGHTS